MSTQMQTIGLWLEVGGAGAFVTGAIVSVHHYAIGVCFLAGIAALYIGKRLRGTW
jgi:hypothetical protein